MQKNKFTVLIPTHPSGVYLDQMLQSLSKAVKDYAVEVYIIENGGHDRDTKAILEPFKDKLNLHYLYCEKRGKNAALNMGWKASEGDVVVCFDDDVEVSESYFEALDQATDQWPNAAAFGGRVSPRWPNGEGNPIHPKIYEYVRSYSFGCTFFMPETDTPYYGPRTPSFTGNNVVFRRSFQDSDEPFYEPTGPMGKRYRMGSGKKILDDLVAAGQELVFLNGPSVRHCIRPEQLEMEWLLIRAENWGRSVGYHHLIYNGIRGTDRVPTLLFKYVLRLLRVFVFSLLRKTIWRDIARLDLALIKGIFIEKYELLRKRENR